MPIIPATSEAEARQKARKVEDSLVYIADPILNHKKKIRQVCM